jgi:hypothetical protein
MRTIKKTVLEIAATPITENSVIICYLDRDAIFLDPDYQRSSNIWSLEKKQLLIDSIVNRFDIPKFYLHEYEKAKKIGGKTCKYALIDGKQRLSAIWGFINADFALSNSAEYLADPSVNIAGLTYTELSSKYPRIAAYFNNAQLALVAIRTNEIELIEELFTRLNEAVPLNAPEKRNAFGGPLPSAIKKVATHRFFAEDLPFTNIRYRHLDIACKFLYLSHVGRPTDIKKLQLDSFVRDFKRQNLKKQAHELEKRCLSILDVMSDVFTKKDSLLKNVGLIVVYYLLFGRAIDRGLASSIERIKFVEFEKLRRENRRRAENDLEPVDFGLLRFDEMANTPNDQFSIQYKLKAFGKFVYPELSDGNND